MKDYRTIKEIIADIKFKSGEVKIDIIQCNSDSDVDVFIKDTKNIAKRLTSLYRKVGGSDKVDTITLVNDIIMEYKMLVYHFRTYNNIGSSIKSIVSDLESLKDKLTKPNDDENLKKILGECKDILNGINTNIENNIETVVVFEYHNKLNLNKLLINRFDLCESLEDYIGFAEDVKELEKGYSDYIFEMLPFIDDRTVIINNDSVVLGYKELTIAISMIMLYIGGSHE